jgi:RimJ/RimL family protein N-acetyltransferase
VRPSYPLRTERLLLRPWTAQDLDAFHGLHSRPDVNRFLIWIPTSRDDSVVKLRKLARLRSLDPPADGIRLAVVLAESGQVIGDVDLDVRSRPNQEGEIGYVLYPEFGGHGYATEAAAEMLRLGFTDAGMHRIVAISDARNAASIRVMERLGMRREALHRAAELARGEWCDLVVYAILAEEWRSAH